MNFLLSFSSSLIFVPLSFTSIHKETQKRNRRPSPSGSTSSSAIDIVNNDFRGRARKGVQWQQYKLDCATCFTSLRVVSGTLVGPGLRSCPRNYSTWARCTSSNVGACVLSLLLPWQGLFSCRCYRWRGPVSPSLFQFLLCGLGFDNVHRLKRYMSFYVLIFNDLETIWWWFEGISYFLIYFVGQFWLDPMVVGWCY